MTENRNTRYRSLINCWKSKRDTRSCQVVIGYKTVEWSSVESLHNNIWYKKKKELKMGHTGKFHAREVSG